MRNDEIHIFVHCNPRCFIPVNERKLEKGKPIAKIVPGIITEYYIM